MNVEADTAYPFTLKSRDGYPLQFVPHWDFFFFFTLNPWNHESQLTAEQEQSLVGTGEALGLGEARHVYKLRLLPPRPQTPVSPSESLLAQSWVASKSPPTKSLSPQVPCGAP